MPDEVDARTRRVRHNLCHVEQHLIAACIAVSVIECFEMIEIEMTRNKGAATRKRLCNVSLNFTVAWQPGQRVGVLRGLDLLSRDVTEQIDGAPHPKIATVSGDNEIIPRSAGCTGSHEPTH